MFEVGFTEIVLILGLALLVLGPEKLPGLAQKVGRWTGRARSMARQLRTQLEHEVTMEDLAKSRPKPSPPDTPADAPQDAPAADPLNNAPPASDRAAAAQDASPVRNADTGLDSETMVTGREPPADPPPAATTEIPTKAPQ